MEEWDEKASCDKQRKGRRQQLGRRQTRLLKGKHGCLSVFVTQRCENASWHPFITVYLGIWNVRRNHEFEYISIFPGAQILKLNEALYPCALKWRPLNCLNVANVQSETQSARKFRSTYCRYHKQHVNRRTGACVNHLTHTHILRHMRAAIDDVFLWLSSRANALTGHLLIPINHELSCIVSPAAPSPLTPHPPHPSPSSLHFQPVS